MDHMAPSIAEIMNKGMKCLREQISIVEAEHLELENPYLGDAVRL
jgi:hypothetical protein